MPSGGPVSGGSGQGRLMLVLSPPMCGVSAFLSLGTKLPHTQERCFGAICGRPGGCGDNAVCKRGCGAAHCHDPCSQAGAAGLPCSAVSLHSGSHCCVAVCPVSPSSLASAFVRFSPRALASSVRHCWGRFLVTEGPHFSPSSHAMCISAAERSHGGAHI